MTPNTASVPPYPVAVATLLDPIDSASVECDGLTRLAHTVLTYAGVDHRCVRGTVGDGHRTLTHWWIELPGGQRVDYRARLWFGPDAPHGVFNDDRGQAYNGAPVNLAPLPPGLFALLAEPVPALPGGWR